MALKYVARYPYRVLRSPTSGKKHAVNHNRNRAICGQRVYTTWSDVPEPFTLTDFCQVCGRYNHHTLVRDEPITRRRTMRVR